MTNALNKSITSTPPSVKSAKNDSIASNKSESDLSPQSIAIVAGRKYVMVPKANKAQATPDSVNGNQTVKSS